MFNVISGSANTFFALPFYTGTYFSIAATGADIAGIEIYASNYPVLSSMTKQHVIDTWHKVATLSNAGEAIFQSPWRNHIVITKNSNVLLYVYNTENGEVSGTNTGNGKSAYELAVQEGYTGTLPQWLISLEGKSAYQIAQIFGYSGTKFEWLQSLVGNDGKSAYELAVIHGFTGTEVDWLASLHGTNGSIIESTDDVPEGVNPNRKYHSTVRVLNTPLASLNPTLPAVITSTDTLIVALEKLQAQINNISGSGGGPLFNAGVSTTIINLGDCSGVVDIDGSTSNHFRLRMIGDIELQFSHLLSGQFLAIDILQDDIGGHTITYPKNSKWGADATTEIDTTGSSASFLSVSNNNYDNYLVMSLITGFNNVGLQYIIHDIFSQTSVPIENRTALISAVGATWKSLTGLAQVGGFVGNELYSVSNAGVSLANGDNILDNLVINKSTPIGTTYTAKLSFISSSVAALGGAIAVITNIRNLNPWYEQEFISIDGYMAMLTLAAATKEVVVSLRSDLYGSSPNIVSEVTISGGLSDANHTLSLERNTDNLIVRLDNTAVITTPVWALNSDSSMPGGEQTDDAGWGIGALDSTNPDSALFTVTEFYTINM